jgi:RecA/RadA recombinase
MSFLKKFAGVGNLSASIAADKESAAEFGGYIDTGSYMLNAVLSGSIFGGVPDNKVTAFAGEQATGKTFFVLGVVKAFLEANPEAVIFYYDTESAVTEEMMSTRGIDTKRVLIIEPQTVQEFRTDVIQKLDAYMEEKNGPKVMMVLDSLGMLSTSKELEDIAAGKDTRDMTRSQVLRGAFRAITLKLARAKVPLLTTNHVYEVVGAYVPTKEMSGGAGLKYAASTIAMLSKKKEKESTQPGAEVIGNIITIRMFKSRLSKENGKAEVRLSYSGGLDKYYGLLELALEAGVAKQISKKYQFEGHEKAYYEKHIYKNAETFFTPEVLQKLDAAAKALYQYGGMEVEAEEFPEEE